MNRLMTHGTAILEGTQPGQAVSPDDHMRKHPRRALEAEPLLTADEVAKRLNVSTDWVWDHSSRKAPYLPVIRMSDGVLRYRLSEVEEFVSERERLSSLRRKRR